MSVRSRLADGLSRAAKALDQQPGPEAMRQAAENVSEMGSQFPFSPGEPLQPYDGYSRTPRSTDYVTGYNISTRPRTHERVSFDTLRGLIEAYDVAEIAIWHRIDSIRSLDWKLVPMDGFNGDPTEAIEAGMQALARPDRLLSFETWLAKWLYDVLAFDAGSLYRLRNRGGQCVGLSVVDGTTIAPLLDYWGNPPAPPAEAYVQFSNGVPWNWLTRNDLIYEPFRPVPRSPYGRPPLETILLNANTDIRFQVYFLQRFTEGNIPEAFASAPETWTPDQIENWQRYWDSMIYGDQSGKHQIKWMPGGSSITWSNEKDFTDQFSLFLMRKTCAAFHVVPADLGFTENVNKSSGESQADVQDRVGDRPLVRYIQRVLTNFLQDDLHLPLRHAFDLGEEQEDRLQQAQADQIYVNIGAISSTEVRELRYGLPETAGRPVPRFIMSGASGPVPLDALFAVAGQIDPETAAPDPDAPLPRTTFTGIPGVVPNPPLLSATLAEDEYGPKALPAAPPPQPAAAVSKEATEGVTAQTGVYGYDGPGHPNDDDDAADAEPGRQDDAVKAELSAFRRYCRTRRRAGTWRDFQFREVPPIEAGLLNEQGRASTVRKDTGEPPAMPAPAPAPNVAGLAVRAADTGRVLMLQRALDPADPAGGSWEFPGGHQEDGEQLFDAAWREWAEETGSIPPPGNLTGSWTSGNGVYRGFVWTVPTEGSVPVRGPSQVTNPDDPDGDQVEAIAWWQPGQLLGNQAVRAELVADLPLVLAALEPDDPGDEVAKAVSADPKARTGRGGTSTSILSPTGIRA